MRLFTAILLPDDVRSRLAGACREWRRRNRGESEASWVRSENLHITLKFLGEVPGPDVPRVCEALGGVPRVGSIRLQPDRIECFPPRGPVRVVAVGLTGDLDRIAQLFTQIEARLDGLGFPKEQRPYLPHVTIARARPPLPRYDRNELMTSGSAGLSVEPFEVERWALVESDLRPTGPVYTPVAIFPLA